MSRRTIAVVGSGVAGLTSAYLLQRVADVTLYEADPRLGGHAHTHEVVDPVDGLLRVDSGFLVHNTATYPLLTRLFAEIGVTTQPAEMSMSVSCLQCGLEYTGGKGAAGLVGSTRQLTNPRYLAMLAEVTRFYRVARRLLAGPAEGDDETPLTVGELVTRERFSAYFVDHFLRPLVATVWSCPTETADRYPARYLFAFLANHGMLGLRGSPRWLTVSGGSSAYVERIAKQLQAVQTSTPVRSVLRTAGGVQIRDDSDTAVRYDGAVIATHADQALSLLAEPTGLERELLGAFGYERNDVVLHTDAAALPTSPRRQASWNYRQLRCRASAESVRVTYDLTRLQRLPTSSRYLVSLGDASVSSTDVVERMVYTHPVYTPESVRAQRRLPELNDGTVAFAGAYAGWGFHEDGCRSGVAAATSLGAEW